ncbi:MAG: hypothetical protein V1875_05775 [Candidatus Altiarchaeota archaeon]
MGSQEANMPPTGDRRDLGGVDRGQLKGKIGLDLNEIRRVSILAYIAPTFDEFGLPELRLPLGPGLWSIRRESMPRFVKDLREGMEHEQHRLIESDDISSVLGRLIYRTRIRLDDETKALFYSGPHGGILHSPESVDAMRRSEDVTVAEALQLWRWLGRTRDPHQKALAGQITAALEGRLRLRSTYVEGAEGELSRPTPNPSEILDDLSAIACDAGIRAHVRSSDPDQWNDIADYAGTGDSMTKAQAREILHPYLIASADVSDVLRGRLDPKRIFGTNCVGMGLSESLLYSGRYGDSSPSWYMGLLMSVTDEFGKALRGEEPAGDLKDMLWSRLERDDVAFDGVPKLTDAILAESRAGLEETKEDTVEVFRAVDWSLNNMPSPTTRLLLHFAEAEDWRDRRFRLESNIRMGIGKALPMLIGFANERDRGEITNEEYDRLIVSNATGIVLQSLELNPDVEGEAYKQMSVCMRLRRLRKKLAVGKDYTASDLKHYAEDRKAIGLPDSPETVPQPSEVNGALSAALKRFYSLLDPRERSMYLLAIEMSTEILKRDPRSLD